MKSSAVVFLEGGIVQEVVADTKMNVIIVDRDVEGAEENNIKSILGQPAYVYGGISESNVDPILVGNVLDDMNLKKEKVLSAEHIFIDEAVEAYLEIQGITEEVSDEQKAQIKDKLQEWLNRYLDDNIAEAVQAVVY